MSNIAMLRSRISRVKHFDLNRRPCGAADRLEDRLTYRPYRPPIDSRRVVDVDFWNNRTRVFAASPEPFSWRGGFMVGSYGDVGIAGGKPKHRAAVFFDRDGVLAIPEIRDGQLFAVHRLEDFAVYAGTQVIPYNIANIAMLMNVTA